jgi:hypothetical protein
MFEYFLLLILAMISQPERIIFNICFKNRGWSGRKLKFEKEMKASSISCIYNFPYWWYNFDFHSKKKSMSYVISERRKKLMLTFSWSFLMTFSSKKIFFWFLNHISEIIHLVFFQLWLIFTSSFTPIWKLLNLKKSFKSEEFEISIQNLIHYLIEF